MSAQERDEIVADIVREGGRVESQVGDSVVVSKPLKMTLGRHALYAVVLVACLALAWSLWPFAILAVLVAIVWWRNAHKVMRWQVGLDDDGEVVQERVP